MRHRFIAILTVVCFAVGLGGCETFFQSSKPRSQKKKKPRKQYEEVLMPGQTGSRLQRRVFVERAPRKEKSPAPKNESTPAKPKATPAPEAEASPSPTPTPEEEASPTPAERFR
ncbi:MAG TPA: hypothetical protein VM940_01120 [Chthoniobacterales bacterium]|jgi:type IV secretory pathway VirB10-like protein|nr:hypothetical protein [Chthoniobacterales bacterium]